MCEGGRRDCDSKLAGPGKSDDAAVAVGVVVVVSADALPVDTAGVETG